MSEISANRELRHRVGVVEIATAVLQTKVGGLEAAKEDFEARLRPMEWLRAQVTLAAILGSSIGGLLLSKMTGCV